uniref:Nudix hydrolase domain-containing protein n=1 Tax=Panagrellus redivivus TaxID=6233 RepID=A0A7E4V849_PANRE
MSPWRLSATTILRNKYREVLMLKRGPTAKFMPNAYVFPGGINDKADASFPIDRSNYELVEDGGELKLGNFENDMPLRVTALRELFEEAGLLLVLDENIREHKVITAVDDPSLIEWREKVKADASKFAELFTGGTKLDCNLLIPWSNWLTPASSPRRFDTVFFVVPIDPPEAIEHCQREMAGGMWGLPSTFIKHSVMTNPISLPPPQYYELARLRLQHTTEREPLERMLNTFKICPQVVHYAKMPGKNITLLPGDFAFDWEKRFVGTPLRELTEREAEPTPDDPVHRMIFNTKPNYTDIEMDIRNPEKIDHTVHLFHFKESYEDERIRLLNQLMDWPSKKSKD